MQKLTATTETATGTHRESHRDLTMDQAHNRRGAIIARARASWPGSTVTVKIEDQD